MRKTLIFSLLLASCSQTVVKPAYIDPEEDLSRKLDQDFETLEKTPSKTLVERLLSNSYTYHKRMDQKVRKNNGRTE